jgi:hypothetical protein
MPPKKKAVAAAAAAPAPAPIEEDVPMGDAPAPAATENEMDANEENADEADAGKDDDVVSVFDEEQRIRIVRFTCPPLSLQKRNRTENTWRVYGSVEYKGRE